MDSRESMSAWTGHPFNSNCGQQSKFKSRWVPLAGKKRKAPDDDPGFLGNYDGDEPPAKQLAVDDEIAPTIVKDGYLIDDSDASNDGSMKFDAAGNKVQLEDMEMDGGWDENDGFEFEGSKLSLPRGSGVNEGVGGVGGHAVKRKEWASKLKENVQLGSVVLSEEVRASLAKKPSDVCPIIPRSLVDQMYKNAMAVVLWQPPPTTLISERVKASMQTSTGEGRDGLDDEDSNLESDTCDISNNSILPVSADTGDMEVEVISNFAS